MQSTAITLSPSAPLSFKPLNKNPNPRCRYNPVSSLKPLDLSSIHHGLSCQKSSYLSSCSGGFNARISDSFLVSNGKYDSFKVKATSVPENIGETKGSSALATTLQLGAMFAIWYLLNIYFNIFNKQVL